jgi:hypothetical protein
MSTIRINPYSVYNRVETWPCMVSFQVMYHNTVSLDLMANTYDDTFCEYIHLLSQPSASNMTNHQYTAL